MVNVQGQMTLLMNISKYYKYIYVNLFNIILDTRNIPESLLTVVIT